MKRWESIGAAIYYGLGISLHLYDFFIAAGIGGGIISIGLRHKHLIFVPVVCTSSAIFLWGVAAWMARTKKRLHLVNPDLLITKLVDVYDVSVAPKYISESTLTVRARRSNVDSYICRFRWSGRGPIDLVVLPQQEVTASLARSADDWDVIRVQFSRPLTKNQEKRFSIRIGLTDETGSALPFFQKFIDDFNPHGLTMKVILASPPTSTLKEIFWSLRAELPVWRQEPQRSQKSTQEVTWKIRIPALEHRYRISWIP